MENWVSGCHGSWGLSGEFYRMQGSWMTAILLSAKPTRHICYNSPLRSMGCPVFPQCFGLAGRVLAAPRAAASQLLTAAPNLLRPLSNHPCATADIPAACRRDESTAPLQTWALRTPCCEEGNVETPGSPAPGQPVVSKADAAGWIQRPAFSTNPPDSFQQSCEWVSAEIRPTPYQPFSEKIPLPASENKVFAETLFSSLLPVSQKEHRVCITSLCRYLHRDKYTK